MRARWQWLAGLTAIALVILAASALFFQHQREKAAASSRADTRAAQPRPTELILPGRLRAKHVVSVAAPIDGTLESLDVIDGQDVFQGQLLARVRNSQLDLAVEQAKLEVERLQNRVNSLDAQVIAARLEASRAEADSSRARSEFVIAEKNYLRQQMLLREGATPRLTFEKAEKDYERLKTESEALSEIARQAASKVNIAVQGLEEARKLLADKTGDLDNAQADLQAAEIHAPVDGLLLSHRASAGEEVKHDMKDLFQIAVNVAEMELTANITTEQAARLQPGQPVVIQVVEAGNQSIEGRVKSAQSSELVVEFASPDPAVKPGLTAQIRVPLDTPPTSQ